MTIATYTEKYRPQFHFTPAAHWMNDPNGMVYFEGEYHLFYQYYPGGTTWGPMHWGHAVSRDLIHWEHLPVALEPDENGFIFSGSAVVDWNDRSGFFSGGAGLVAIFTHHKTYPDSEKTKQCQSIAYSKDKGRTWIKYEGNPVLTEEQIVDFRDPKVFWHEKSKQWVMVLAAGDHIRFYSSFNLKEWVFTGEFGAAEGSHDGVWECPDLFELPVNGQTEQKKWVLIVSIGDNSACPEGSRTQYFVGDFNGRTFTNENTADTVLWVDHGRDNYAGVSWSDIPNSDGRRLLMGWMSNWKYANMTPTETWRSAMTIPRVLSLHTDEAGIRLKQQPVQELQSLRQAKLFQEEIPLASEQPISTNMTAYQLEIKVEFEIGDAEQLGLKLNASAEEATLVGYDTRTQSLFIDRTKSGKSDFHPQFACKHEASLQPENGRIQMQLFVDWSSVEVFANDGKVVMSDLIFPVSSNGFLEVFAAGGAARIVSLEVYELSSIHASSEMLAANESL
ncbi:fructan beta-fructosidase [Paenibacillus castaneae]|uniref:glycoside hydrolase family 32 protein n=1 Tax=Paenibacillus castaneae TaxID=474957 RepID=UPI000C9BA524|nr:glycoside hydrolase family 32 protein [Paenibacillus castaneae]NIK78577.1 fructan beta-fructosidase [Paenibacillus castaneae]